MKEYCIYGYIDNEKHSLDEVLAILPDIFETIVVLCDDCIATRVRFFHNLFYKIQFENKEKFYNEIIDKMNNVQKTDGHRIELLLVINNKPIYAQISRLILKVWSYSLHDSDNIECLLSKTSIIKRFEKDVIDVDSGIVPPYVSYEVCLKDKCIVSGEQDAVHYMSQKIKGMGLKYFVDTPKEFW
jgi:hypothetical protein